MVVMIIGVFTILVDNGEFPEWIIFVRSLQFILHLSLMNIGMPANVIAIY